LNWAERLLRRYFPHKEIGWKEINEEFTRYTLLTTRWGKVFLHQLYAPIWHPQCHDHPWDFWSIILWNGYLELMDGREKRFNPGNILYRSAESTHNVITPYGTSWSLVFVSKKRREWSIKQCEA
jgi:hypothetical protein